jgi:hypothetical protein
MSSSGDQCRFVAAARQPASPLNIRSSRWAHRRSGRCFEATAARRRSSELLQCRGCIELTCTTASTRMTIVRADLSFATTYGATK